MKKKRTKFNAKEEYPFPAFSLRVHELGLLCDSIEEVLLDEGCRNVSGEVTLWGDSYCYRRNLKNSNQSREFPKSLEAIEVEVECEGKAEVYCLLSARAQPPSNPRFSRLVVEAVSERIRAKLVGRVKRFADSRKNYNKVFHEWGIPIALFGSQLLMSMVYFDLRALGWGPIWLLPALVLLGGILSFPVKDLLRWAYPFVEFVGSSEIRDIFRLGLVGLVVGVIANAFILVVTAF